MQILLNFVCDASIWFIEVNTDGIVDGKQYLINKFFYFLNELTYF